MHKYWVEGTILRNKAAWPPHTWSQFYKSWIDVGKPLLLSPLGFSNSGFFPLLSGTGITAIPEMSDVELRMKHGIQHLHQHLIRCRLQRVKVVCFIWLQARITNVAVYQWINQFEYNSQNSFEMKTAWPRSCQEFLALQRMFWWSHFKVCPPEPHAY